MKFTQLSLLISTTITTNMAMANDFVQFEYFPPKTWRQQLLDAANSWVRKQGEKASNEVFILSQGGEPSLDAWRGATRNWEPLVCIQAKSEGVENSGVWINNNTTIINSQENFAWTFPAQMANYKTFFVAANQPYEIESKNYARAGVKRFFKYHHSFRIDHPISFLASPESEVIDNVKSHDYDTSATFKMGENWIHSTTFTDYDGIQVNIGGNLSDYNGVEDWLNWKNYEIGVKWPKSVHLSDCGFALVVAQQNTRPVIHEVSTEEGRFRLPDAVGRGDSGQGVKLTPHASDNHTDSNNLRYSWVVDGERLNGRTPIFFPKDLNPYKYWSKQPRPPFIRNISYSLTVSDGDLTAVYNGTFKI